MHRRAKRVFISPNGFAAYFGAPRGAAVTRPDTLVQPRRVLTPTRRAIGAATLPVILLTLLVSVAIGVLLRRRFPRRTLQLS